MQQGALGILAGSSPRVRGKPVDEGLHRGRGGLIPACAGKTGPSYGVMGLWAAHPRVCGENVGGAVQAVAAVGSSPRVRGKRWGVRPTEFLGGLIPACAGKTCRAGPPTGSPAAHPRVCGENDTRAPPPAALIGSSPRVRGKHEAKEIEEGDIGLIPACAGKT